MKNFKNSIINNEKGFSILEVTVVAGIMLIMMMGSISVTTTQNKQIKIMTQKVAINDLTNSIIRVMQNTPSCLNNLTTVVNPNVTFDSTAGNPTISLNKLVAGAGGTSQDLVVVNQEILPGSSIKASSITLKNLVNAGGGKWTGTWEIGLTNESSSFSFKPIQLASQSFDVDLVVPTAARITGCDSVVVSGGTSNWNTTGSNVYYTLGNVGIGTTTPTSTIHAVSSGAKTSSFTGINLENNATSSTAVVDKVGLNISSTGTWNGSPAVNRGLTVDVADGTTNYAATFMGGNVGIGINSPSNLLHVASTVNSHATAMVSNSSSANQVRAQFMASAGGSDLFSGVLGAGVVPGLNIYGNAGDGYLFLGGSGGKSLSIANNTGGSAAIKFHIGHSQTVPKMIIGATGNVGIGTAAPTNNLFVQSSVVGGGIEINTNASNSPALTLSDDQGKAVFGFSRGLRHFSNISDNGDIVLSVHSWPAARDLIFSNQDNGAIFFSTGLSDGTDTGKMAILQNGNVGIGTMSPTQKLEVAGTLKVNDNLYSSDRTLKNNIVSLSPEEEIKKIRNLDPVKFKWNQSGLSDIGFIAQDLQLVYPELVYLNPDDTYSVRLPSLLGPIVSSIKNIDGRLVELEQENSELKKTIEQLVSKVQRLELVYQEQEKKKIRAKK